MALTTRRATDTRSLPPDSLQPVLSSILDGIASVLIDDAGRQALLDCGGTLPRVLARRSLGLELRLQGPPTGNLVVTSVPSAPDGAQLHRSLMRSLREESPIRHVARTLSDARTPDSWLARSCAGLLLEIDSSRAAAGELAPLPCVYLVPRDVTDDTDERTPAQNAFHADPFGLLGALATINGAPLDHRTCFELKSVLEAMPDRAELYAAGAMPPGEERRAPRVAVRGFAAGDVKPFLKAIARKREAKTLVPVAKALGRTSTNLCISLDLDPDKSDTVGLEVHPGSSSSTGQVTGWEALLTALVDRKLADADRAAAALKLVSADGAEPPTGSLSHVKITTVAGALADTRIYVGYENLT